MRPESEHVAEVIFEHGLHPSVAREPLDALRMDHQATLNLRTTATGVWIESRMNDDGGSVLIGVDRDGRRTDHDESIGPARRRARMVILIGHLRDLLRHPIDRSHHYRPLVRR